MLLGLRTVIYPVADLAAAKAWYGRVFECSPYFDEAYYVGYKVGGFELGLIPDGRPGTDGAQAYWGVANIDTELLRITTLGATALQAVTEVGGGIRVAAVSDPFGNALHLIENPHFDLTAVR